MNAFNFVVVSTQHTLDTGWGTELPWNLKKRELRVEALDLLYNLAGTEFPNLIKKNRKHVLFLLLLIFLSA
jgi:hypothetical protein